LIWVFPKTEELPIVVGRRFNGIRRKSNENYGIAVYADGHDIEP
jgi:hypothetical protein